MDAEWDGKREHRIEKKEGECETEKGNKRKIRK